MLGELPLLTSIFFCVFQVALLACIAYFIARAGRLRAERDALLEEKNVVFNFVYDVSEVFAESDEVDIRALLKRVVSYGLRVTGAKAGALYLLESDHETLHPGAITGMFPPLAGDIGDIGSAFSKVRYVERLVRQRSIKVGEGLVGEVLAQGTAIRIEDPREDKRVPRFNVDFLQVDSILLVPMRFRHSVLGVLAVVNRMDGRPFTETDASLLQALADQASVSIHYARISATLDEKRRMDYDLGIARRIQTALLPKDIPQMAGLHLSAFSVPAQQIGGDYYDFVNVDDDHLGIAIADVSGKGVAGAIVMSICRSLLRTEAPGCLSPVEVLKSMNRIISLDLQEDMFVSILYMVLDTKTHELVIARGGHVEPVLCRRGGAEPQVVESAGMAIGLSTPDVFDEVLEERRVTLGPGDMIVGYTDGVTEAQDRSEQEWGILNLAKTVQTVTFEGGDADAVAGSVRQRLLEFCANMPQYDDMTLVALQVIE